MPALENSSFIVTARLAGFLDHEGTPAMAQGKLGSTDPKLLKRVAALWDNPAWGEFFQRYDPLVRGWCSAYGLDAASIDEVCQRVWVELARRMPSYQYDPGGSFRGWLRRLCRHRAIDLYREHHDRPYFELGAADPIDERRMAGENIDGEPADDEIAPRGCSSSRRPGKRRRKSGARSSRCAGKSSARADRRRVDERNGRRPGIEIRHGLCQR